MGRRIKGGTKHRAPVARAHWTDSVNMYTLLCMAIVLAIGFGNTSILEGFSPR